MTTLKVYSDMVSPPCRAVSLLLQVNQVPHQLCSVDLFAREQFTNEELAKINPNRKTPAIDDNGFYLFESAAIMKYIVIKYKLPDHWYPSELQHQIKIDEYLHWHHTFLRRGASYTIYHKAMGPVIVGAPPNEVLLKELTEKLEKSLDLLEKYFLEGHKFINGDKISIADLQALCEFSQFIMTGFDPFADKPRLAKWMADCKEVLGPHFDKVHEKVYKTRDEGKFLNKM